MINHHPQNFPVGLFPTSPDEPPSSAWFSRINFCTWPSSCLRACRNNLERRAVPCEGEDKSIEECWYSRRNAWTHKISPTLISSQLLYASIYLSIDRSIARSICISIYLSVYLSIYRYHQWGLGSYSEGIIFRNGLRQSKLKAMELRSKTAENERQSALVPPKYFFMPIVIYTVCNICFNLCFVIFVFCSFVSFGRLLKKQKHLATPKVFQVYMFKYFVLSLISSVYSFGICHYLLICHNVVLFLF